MLKYKLLLFLFISLFAIKRLEARSKNVPIAFLKVQLDTLRVAEHASVDKNENLWKFVSRGYLRLDFGWNFPQNQGANLDHSIWGSRGVNFSYLHAFPLFKSPFSLNAGLGVGHTRLMFKNNVVLIEKDGKLEAQNFHEINNDGINRSLEKSIFAQTFLEIPLELAYHGIKNRRIKSGFFVAVGMKFGYNISNKVKLVYKEASQKIVEKTKKKYHTNDFRSILTFRVGWSRFNILAEYSLTPIFKPQKAPGSSADMQSFLIGLSLDLI